MRRMIRAAVMNLSGGHKFERWPTEHSMPALALWAASGLILCTTCFSEKPYVFIEQVITAFDFGLLLLVVSAEDQGHKLTQ